MEKIKKEDIIKLLADLKAKGFSEEELAVMIGRTQQTIWAWGSKATTRVPGKSDYYVLERILNG